MNSLPSDIRELDRKLRGRYLRPIIRPRGDVSPPFITVTDGGNTNIRISRGDGLFPWEVTGEISGQDVEFSAENSQDLLRKLDDKLDRQNILEDFIRGGL